MRSHHRHCPHWTRASSRATTTLLFCKLDMRCLATLFPTFCGFSLRLLNNLTVSSMSPKLIGHLSRLVYLSMRRLPMLTALNASMFQNNTALQLLYAVSFCLLTTCTGLICCDVLQLHRSLGETALSELPPGIFNSLSNLTILHLDYMQLARLDASLFSNNGNLRLLYV